MPTLHIATSNRGKLDEFRLGVRLWQEQRGGPFLLDVLAIEGFASLPPCIEDGETFRANAVKKTLHYSQHVAGLILADDSGLEVDALDGAPGVRSRRYAGPSATDPDNNAKLLRQLSSVPPERRNARFVCVLALARDGRLLADFSGVAEGIILESLRGAQGFGYDPLFLDPVAGRTFAELTSEEKLVRSHRGQALWRMLNWLAAEPL